MAASLAPLARPARAQGEPSPSARGLTEAEAVGRALARPALADASQAAVAVTRSDAIREGLWPDPELTYNREQTFGPRGAAQDSLWITQRIELSGRRGLRAAASNLRARGVSHLWDARRAEIEADVRLSFHELLAAQLRVAVIRNWQLRIEAIVAIVSRRAAAGDAAGYDLRRLERERANARGRLAFHLADGDRAWARLAALLGETLLPGGGPPTLAGPLLPEAPKGVEGLLSGIERRPDLLALDVEVEAAQADGEAASRGWVPALALGLGWTGVAAGRERSDGYLAMATLSVPLFDRRQDEVLRAASESRLARARRELVLAEARGEAQGRAAELARLVEAAQDFRRDAIGGSAALMRTAEAGYAGDELGILELLDAYRGGFDDEMTALDLELAARRAQVALGRLFGGHAP